MPKHEFLTPKAIAKRIKAKGLQKLRWFCQMCSKQCRDENGFKCHCESESHQRQMSVFSQNPHKFVDSFSKEFENSFMDILRRRFGTRRVHANLVYQEFISDRTHTHMNSTQWVSLTEFIKYLGRSGKCEVDETEKGWFMAYIERDPAVIAKQEALAKKERMDKGDEYRQLKYFEKLNEAALERIEDKDEEFNELKKDEGQKITFTLFPKKEEKEEKTALTTSTSSSTSPESTSMDYIIIQSEQDSEEQTPMVNNLAKPIKLESKTQENSVFPITGTITKKEDKAAIKMELMPSGSKRHWDDTEPKSNVSKINTGNKKQKKSSLDQIMEQEQNYKEKINRKDFWLTTGIIVKCMNKELADGKYYKKKGEVKKVIELYVAEIQVQDFGDIIQLDQNQLETVIPNIGGRVKIVNGAYRGETGILQSIDVDHFCATVKIDKGALNGKLVERIEYEDICKIL